MEWRPRAKDQSKVMLKRIPDYLYRYSALKEEEHSRPLVKYGPCIVTAFSKVSYGKRGGKE